MTKKFFAILLALVLTFAMSAVEFADPTPTYSDMSTVTVSKTYELTNAGTTSPAETFRFTALTCTKVENAGVGVTTGNAPVPTIGSVSYAAGEAGSNTATKNITITLPPYTAVGVYTYTFTEEDGGTAGVSYHTSPITLKVTVIEQNGKVRVAAVHTEDGANGTVADGKKSDDFDNTYSAGSLSVKKVVEGIMGDRDKNFTVTVTFTAPAGDTVRSDITYTDDSATNNVTLTNGVATAVITLKHDETVTFTNIPYGVTYTVDETDYTNEGYATTGEVTEAKTINSDSVTETITNTKGGTVDTGITMDSMPYIVLLALAVVGLAAVTMKKRYEA